MHRHDKLLIRWPTANAFSRGTVGGHPGMFPVDPNLAFQFMDLGRPGSAGVFATIDEFAVWIGRTLGAFEVYNLYQSLLVRTNTDPETVKFGYGDRGARNLASVSKTVDSSWMTNFMIVQGQGNVATGAAYMIDPRSMATYGEFDETQSLSDQDSLDILSAYASAEVALRGRPRITYVIKPLPYVDLPNTVGIYTSVPEVFRDYGIGDFVLLDALDGTIDVARQPMRIFGITIAIDDNGNEDVTLVTAVGG